MNPIGNRYDFVYFFDVRNGNPNGDPDAGNLPRLDPETNRGLVTDVCLKRKIRNHVQLAHDNQPGHAIYVSEGAILNQHHAKAWKALDLKPDNNLPKDEEKARELTLWMCRNFFDIRTFGAVMSTKVNCGQVRGPVQMAFAQSIDPIVPLEISITRMAATDEKEAGKKSAGGEESETGGPNRTMGRKFIVPYALYRVHGFVSAKLAEKTGFSEADLETLWQALEGMFENDRSAARGEMAARKLIVFKHTHPMGNAPAHVLFDRIGVSPRANLDGPARDYRDYVIHVDESRLPEGVEMLNRF
ncbi:MAG: type I-C CRISPR-associated protein Cas7/Csd2 [Magnetococcus sp. WYHC-3]